MPSKSKAKGSSYERDLAKFLSEKYNGSFVRVPNSGAYIGGSNFHRATNLSEGQVRGFKGDIIWDKSKPDGTPRKLLDISKIKSLGWEPKIKLDEGLKLTIEDFERKYLY